MTGPEVVKKLIIAISLSALVTGVFAASALAAEGWKATIKVTAGNASSRLVFGQHPDATVLLDGPYDVPAMLSGTLQARFVNDNADDLWRDIRTAGEPSEWLLLITNRTGSPVSLSWASADLPAGFSVELADTVETVTVDMKSASGYTLNGVSEAELYITIK